MPEKKKPQTVEQYARSLGVFTPEEVAMLVNAHVTRDKVDQLAKAKAPARPQPEQGETVKPIIQITEADQAEGEGGGGGGTPEQG